MSKAGNRDQIHLVLDDKISAPPAINRHVASVALRPSSNSYDDGYELAVSAVLGADDLTLQIGQAELDIKLDINFFEIDMTFARSSVEFGRGFAEFESASKGAERKHTAKQTSQKWDGGGRIDVSERIKVNLGLGAMDSSDTSTVRETEHVKYPFHHLEIGCLAAGDAVVPSPLLGNVIQDYVGWKVTPNTKNSRSGALARLRVKRNWISMREPRIRSGASRIAERLRAMFGGESEADKLKTAAFPILLEALVHSQLQEPDETDFATLAASVVAVKPIDEMQETLVPKQEHRTIQIDLSVVEDFLSLPAPEVIGFLQGLENNGAMSSHLEHTRTQSEDTAKKTTEDVWTDDASVANNNIPVHYPNALLDSLVYAQNSLLQLDHDVSIATFNDITAVDYLVTIGLLTMTENYIRGIDMTANDKPDIILAERILDISDMRRVFDAYTLTAESGYKKRPEAYKPFLNPTGSANLFAALYDADDNSNLQSGEEAALETLLWEWCHFIRNSLHSNFDTA